VNSGSLMRRTNFLADMVGDLERPGVSAVVDGLKTQGELSSEGFVDTCLDLMGPLQIGGDAREELVSHADQDGPLRWSSEEESSSSAQRVGEMLQLIVSLRDFQFN
jgi:hypothetical protein